MKPPITRIRHRMPARGDDRGVTLIYALIFITVIAIVVAAVLSLSDTNLRTTIALRDQAAEAAAADGAAQIAINELRTGDYVGPAGDCFPSSPTLNLDDFYQAPDGSDVSARVECGFDDSLSVRPGATGAGFALLSLPASGQEGLTLNGIDPPNPSQVAGMETHGDVANTGPTHIKHGQLKVVGDFTSASCVLDMNTKIIESIQLPGGGTQDTQITPLSPECADPTGTDPNYVLPPGATPGPAGDWNPKGNCAGQVRTFEPGVYSTTADLNALNDKCGVSYFKPGIYWFAFNGSENSNNKFNTWVTQNKVVAGAPVGTNLSASVHDIAKDCSPFENFTPGAGVLFVFGGRSSWVIDKDGQVAMCARPSEVTGQPALAFYSLKTAVGSVPAQTGCTLLNNTSSSACPTFRTTNANNVTLYLEGSTYLPKGWVDLDLHSSLQYIVGGLVTRQFSLFSPASSELPAPLSSGPLPGGSGEARTVVVLNVFVCPNGGSCASGGGLRLKVKIGIVDPSVVVMPGQRKITVYSWSVQR